MKTLLVLTDHSSSSFHAAKQAFSIGQKIKANLLLVNTPTIKNIVHRKEYVLAAELASSEFEEGCAMANDIPQMLIAGRGDNAFLPSIEVIEMAVFSESELSTFINEQEIWMIIKGVDSEKPASPNNDFNVRAILNRVRCPLMLVPESFEIKDFKNMVYTMDLRYCRIQIARYLKQLATAFGASLHIAHLSAKGLPHMEQNYACTVFRDTIGNSLNYDKLFFNNILERDLKTVMDVLVNGMHTDLVAMVNHRYHFEQIVGRGLYHIEPPNIKVPILIFPY